MGKNFKVDFKFNIPEWGEVTLEDVADLQEAEEMALAEARDHVASLYDEFEDIEITGIKELV